MTDYNASHIIKRLGDDILIEKLGFTQRNLRHVKSTGKFSGNWYASVKSLCDAHGIYCPLSAFKWFAHDKKHGNAATDVQGQAAQ